MSVINQVLNQLEQRGAHTAAEQPMVRAVMHTRRNLVMPLLALGLVLVAVIAAWQWMPSRKPVLSSAEGPAVMTESVVPNASQKLLPTESAGNSPNFSGLEKLAPQKQSTVPIAVPESSVSAPDTPGSPAMPASRLSFELSSVPVPTSLRPFEQAQDRPLRQAQDRLGSGHAASPFATSGGSGQALSGGNSNPAANSVTASKPETGASVPAARPQNKPVAPVKAKFADKKPANAAPMKQISSAQQADAEFRRAADLMQLGHIGDAIAGYEAALRLDAGHDAARQALVALLLEGKRNVDAEKVLLEGLKNKPGQTGLAMLLARLQVERGALEQATETLEKSAPFADTQADYRAFLAALLQRQNRHEEAISHYQIALQHAPNNGVWLMGYGISLQAVRRYSGAKDAFQSALDTKMLSPELQKFVQQKLKGL